IPLKLTECSIHPKLEVIQYLDFSIPGVLPWELLIERIKEIETTPTEQSETDSVDASSQRSPDPDDFYVKAILAYLNQRGYQMVSFERIRKRIDANLPDKHLRSIVAKNKSIFRLATLEGGRKGLAKLIP
ncbi:MAG TPA: hypothetical protein VGB98_00330, partial [Pyrinomonadaceae bacterium]